MDASGERLGSQESQVCSLFRRRVVASDDGLPLSVFEAGEPKSEALVLANAYGIPVNIWEPIARALQRDFRLVTWESRHVPNLDHAFEPSRCGVANHTGDLRAVMDACGVERARLIGWCSGAQVVLRFASEQPQRVEAAALLSGSYRSFVGVPSTQFQATLNVMLQQCAANRRRCDVYWRILFGGGLGGPPATQNGAPPASQLSSTWAHIPPEIQKLTAVPYRTAESLYRYASSQVAVEQEPLHAWTEGADAPILVVGGAEDAIVHADAWREVSRRLEHSRLIMRPKGDHYLLYRDDSMPDLLRAFFADPRRLVAADAPA